MRTETHDIHRGHVSSATTPPRSATQHTYPFSHLRGSVGERTHVCLHQRLELASTGHQLLKRAVLTHSAVRHDVDVVELRQDVQLVRRPDSVSVNVNVMSMSMQHSHYRRRHTQSYQAARVMSTDNRHATTQATAIP